MIRTKHLVLALGVSALTAVVAGVLFSGGTMYSPVLTAAFSLPRDAYEVVSGDYRSQDERRSAFIASVREALRIDPVPEPEPVPVPLPPEPEPITVSIPPGHGAPGYGDAPATITPGEPMFVPAAETPALFVSPSEAQTAPSATSTQPGDVPVSGAGVQ